MEACEIQQHRIRCSSTINMTSHRVDYVERDTPCVEFDLDRISRQVGEVSAISFPSFFLNL
jgi:hypothetical protein